MIDVVILNRNLGTVCDDLVADLDARLSSDSNIVVVDAGSEFELQSQFTTVRVDTEEVRRDGLRFGRGMNIGIRYIREKLAPNPWVLLLPVDTEIVSWNLISLFDQLMAVPEVVALKPLELSSAYATHLQENSIALAWNLEEGPWLISTAFLDEQILLSQNGEFFDHNNYRGYLTSIDIAFRAYSNGYSVGITNCLTTNENESYLIERAELIKTDPIDVNAKMLVEEGMQWLGNKYGISDPWAFAQLVRLLHDRFFDENPELVSWRLNYDHK